MNWDSFNAVYTKINEARDLSAANTINDASLSENFIVCQSKLTNISIAEMLLSDTKTDLEKLRVELPDDILRFEVISNEIAKTVLTLINSPIDYLCEIDYRLTITPKEKQVVLNHAKKLIGLFQDLELLDKDSPTKIVLNKQTSKILKLRTALTEQKLIKNESIDLSLMNDSTLLFKAPKFTYDPYGFPIRELPQRVQSPPKESKNPSNGEQILEILIYIAGVLFVLYWLGKLCYAIFGDQPDFVDHSGR